MTAVDLRAGSIRIAVRLTPKGGRDAIEGWSEDAAGRKVLKARVAAPPEDGKANKALIDLLAKALGVAKSKVSILSGGTTRVKLLEIEGKVETLAAAARRLGANA